ncbi:MAG: hypothetical protein AAGB03_03355 [Pseudomonadota bacterium]
MITGRDTLRSIRSKIKDAKRDLRRLEKRGEKLGNSLTDIQTEKNVTLRSLATVRLPHVSTDNPASTLLKVEEDVRALLAQRADDHANTHRTLERIDTEIEGLEEERDTAIGGLADVTDRLDDTLGAVQERLERNNAFQATLSRIETLEHQARRAEQKAAQAQADREEKGKPYEEDPLFAYLWRRRFGTSDYKALSLFRYLDGVVARRIRYEEARINYHMLLEIPKRLSDHAASLRAGVEAAMDELKSLEDEAQNAAGIPALRESLAKQEAAIAAVDARLETQRETQQKLSRRIRTLSLGDDPHNRQALDLLAAGYGDVSVATLRRAATLTEDLTDDELIDELDALDREIAEAEGELQDVRKLIARQADRVEDLEEIAREFKNRDYDRPGSIFDDDDIVEDLLNAALKGAIGGFWDVLGRENRYRTKRTRPRFGTSRFPTKRQSTWTPRPSIDLGRAQRRMGHPRPNRRTGPAGKKSRGGFRTGGGF